jgi:hypothetical protein
VTDWGLCATIKAPADQVRAFVAHHLALGAAHLWLHFDDPADPAMASVAGAPRVTAVACDDAYWAALNGRRPNKHQQRQSRNAERVYAMGALPWIGHIDVDEFLWPTRPVSQVLAEVPAQAPVLRMAPWEALHDPALPDDIFTARHFRGPLRGPAKADLRRVVFGPYADLLESGSLSHAVGKCFFRRGVPGLQPRIHTGVIEGEKVHGGAFSPDIALLHFHAQDPVAWRDRLAFRRTKGAYSFNVLLMGWLGMATDADLQDFYDRVQVASPGVLDTLRHAGALLEADLGLRARLRDFTFR